MEGTRSLLLQTGMPPGFWPYAMRAYCMSENITPDMDGDYRGISNWEIRHRGSQFKGLHLPFGCLVNFEPTPDKADDLPKASPRGIPGVFMGWKLNPGGMWNGEYLVAPLTAFKKLDFSIWGSAHDVEPETVQEIVHDGMSYTFPVKAEYDRCNSTLEGIRNEPVDSEDVPPMKGDDEILVVD